MLQFGTAIGGCVLLLNSVYLQFWTARGGCVLLLNYAAVWDGYRWVCVAAEFCIPAVWDG